MNGFFQKYDWYKYALLLSFVYLSNMGIHAQDFVYYKKAIQLVDSCLYQQNVAVLIRQDDILVTKNISRDQFHEIKKISIISTCMKMEFPVKSCKMIGISKSKDPIVIDIIGSQITANDLNKCKSLGRSFTLYVEDIRGSNACMEFVHSIKLEVY